VLFIKFPFFITIFDVLFSGVFVFLGLGTGLMYFFAFSILVSVFSFFLYKKNINIVLAICLLLLFIYLLVSNVLVYEKLGIVNLLRPLGISFLILVFFQYRDKIRIDEFRSIILWLYMTIKYTVLLSFLLYLFHRTGLVTFERLISFGDRFSGLSYELLSASYVFFILIYLNGIMSRHSTSMIIIGLIALYLTKSNFLLVILFAYFVSYFQKINIIPKGLSALSILIIPLLFLVIMYYLNLNEHNIVHIVDGMGVRGGGWDVYARLLGLILLLNDGITIDILPPLFGNGIYFKDLLAQPMLGFVNMFLDFSWLYIIVLSLIALYYYRVLFFMHNGEACISEYAALNVSIMYLFTNPVYYSPLPMFIIIFIVRISELRKYNKRARDSSY
jgi:hypothetical protein